MYTVPHYIALTISPSIDGASVVTPEDILYRSDRKCSKYIRVLFRPASGSLVATITYLLKPCQETDTRQDTSKGIFHHTNEMLNFNMRDDGWHDYGCNQCKYDLVHVSRGVATHFWLGGTRISAVSFGSDQWNGMCFYGTDKYVNWLRSV